MSDLASRLGRLSPAAQELLLRRLQTLPGDATRAGAAEAGPRLAPRPRPLAGEEERPPLSFAQQRLWFLDQLLPGEAAFHIPLVVRLRGDLAVAELAAALTAVVRRHEVLRTAFPAREGEAWQVVAPPPRRALQLPVVDLGRLDAEDRERENLRLARRAAERPFDLAKGPLLRLLALRLGRREHTLVVVLHHVIGDAWSLGVLASELAALYRGPGEPALTALPELPVQYADFAVWQRRWLAGERLAGELAHWRQRLEGEDGLPPPLVLPTDRPPPPVPSSAGASEVRWLSPPLTAAIEELGQRLRVTPFMLWLAVFGELLHRLTGQDDLTLGTPVAGRERLEIEGLIGFFVNTLVLRLRPARAATFADLLDEVRDTTLDAFAHASLPFERLVEELAPTRRLDETPLFRVMLVYQNAPAALPRLAGLEVEPLEWAHPAAEFDLTLTARRVDERMVAVLEHRTDLFDSTTVRRWLGALETALAAAVENPRQPLAALSFLSPAERQALRHEWSGAGLVAREAPLLPELIARQAALYPDVIAVRGGDEAVSYAELARRAHRQAHRLIAAGARPEGVVALAMERSVAWVVVVAAVASAGAPFLPMDPALQPAERLAYMIRDSGAGLLVVHGGPPAGLVAALGEEPEEAALPILDLAEGLEGPAPDGPPVVALLPEHLAYLIYTSGSTGKPKAAAISHGALALLAVADRDCFAAGPGDHGMLTASPSFDAAIEDTLISLATGATLHVEGPRERLYGEGLARYLAERAITHLSPTPSLMRSLGEVELPRLALLVTGGEPLTQELLQRWAPGRFVGNSYGPTEATVSTTFGRCWPGAPISIGRPMLGLTTYVATRRLELVPTGGRGELMLGGARVARGYAGRPARTAASFVPDPWSAEPGGRLYKTGDLARLWADGQIDFLGRIDAQVKVRGYRVELGEIEAALLDLPEIDEAAVVAVERGAEIRLVAHVVARGGEPPAIAGLRRELARRLPEHMLPGGWVFVAQLPRTASGKLDRRALREAPLPLAAQGEEAARGESDPLQAALAGIWRGLLGIERAIAPGEDFFALGGHSLLAAQMVARVRGGLGVELPLAEVFQRPTLGGLAQALGERLGGAGEAALPPLVRVPRDRPLPLSFAQQRLWFVDRLSPGNVAYNMPFTFRVSGPLALGRLAASLGRVVARHEILRTTYELAGEEIVQVVGPPAPVPLLAVDLSALPPAVAEGAALAQARAEAARPISLRHGPMLRLGVWTLGPERHLVGLFTHHIAFDGWSGGLLLEELAPTYAALAAGEEPALPPLPVQYADFAAWQRDALAGDFLARQLDYWKPRLAGMPELLALPTDRIRPAVQRFRGGGRGILLPPGLADGLRALAQSRGLTLFMALLGLLQALLSRLSGQRDVVVSSGVANRQRLETEPLIGCLINIVLLRTDLAGEPSFDALAPQLRSVVIGAWTHQDLPFERLVEELRPERDASHNPLTQVMLVLDNTPQSAARMADIEVEPIATGWTAAQLDLNFQAQEEPGGLRLGVQYDADLFDATTLGRWLASFAALATGAVAEPGRSLFALPILSPAERQQLAREWNATAAEFPREAGVDELIADAARRHPDAPALFCGADGLSFGELAARSHRLAHHLIASGVRPGQMVGLCAERSLGLVVGLLGILEAGAGYLPLDPKYPRERLGFMIEDARLELVVTQESLVPLTAELVPGQVSLDGDAAAIAARPATVPPRRVGADSLVYVIYTSGSTGKPKGALLDHRGRVNNFVDLAARFRIGGGDRIFVPSSPSFDMFAHDLLGPLMVGATVVLPCEATAYDTAHWADLLARHRVTIWHSVPALLDLYLEHVEAHPETAPRGLRLALAGGDWIPVSQPERLRAWVPGCEFWSLGGATEVSVDSIVFRVDQRDPAWKSIPYGRPLLNQSGLILDRRLDLSPVGVPGELHLGGIGLAWGYLRRPAFSAERFVPDAHAGDLGGSEPGARLYKTGDLARLLADGTIELLGRLDNQVQLRGLRVELGEIEAALRLHPAVAEAVVMARRESGEPRVVAYVVRAAAVEPGELRQHLEERLPSYMVPAIFVFLPRLPLTPNGKLDRKALPIPETPGASGPADDLDRPDFSPPADAVEERLATVWQEVLGLPRVGRLDNFFDCGGDSFAAIRVVQRYGAPLTLVDLLRHSTLDRLAEVLRAREGATGAPAGEDGLLITLKTARPAPGVPAVDLVCVPFSGGLATIYRPLAAALPAGFAVHSLALPGHDPGRPDEALLPLDELARAACEEILERWPGDRRLAIYGHCGGSALALRLAQLLEAAGRPLAGVVIGAALPEEKPSWLGRLAGSLGLDRLKSDDQLFAWLRSLGGFGDLESPETIRFTLRALRHDMRLAQQAFQDWARAKRLTPLAAPLCCVVGDADPLTASYAGSLAAWRRFAPDARLEVIPGAEHYFVQHQPDAVARILRALLANGEETT